MNRKETLDTAAFAVTGERQEDYGSPEDNFRRIAYLWGSYLDHGIDTSDVAAMMVLLKIARIRSSPDHMDSWVDIAGYAACGAECSTAQMSEGQRLQKEADEILRGLDTLPCDVER